jgi:hypothetical protein
MRHGRLQSGGQRIDAGLLRGGRQYAAPPGNTWQVRPSGWSLVRFQAWASQQLIDQRCCWSWVTMLSIRGVRQPRPNSRSGPGPTGRPTTPRCTGLLTVSTVSGAAAKPRQPPQDPRVMAAGSLPRPRQGDVPRIGGPRGASARRGGIGRLRARGAPGHHRVSGSIPDGCPCAGPRFALPLPYFCPTGPGLPRLADQHLSAVPAR